MMDLGMLWSKAHRAMEETQRRFSASGNVASDVAPLF